MKEWCLTTALLIILLYCVYVVRSSVLLFTNTFPRNTFPRNTFPRRDPISLILMTRFEILGTRMGSLKHLKKTLLFIPDGAS